MARALLEWLPASAKALVMLIAATFEDFFIMAMLAHVVVVVPTAIDYARLVPVWGENGGGVSGYSRQRYGTRRRGSQVGVGHFPLRATEGTGRARA